MMTVVRFFLFALLLGLAACSNSATNSLKEMSLTDEVREEVHASLTNLMEHGNRLNCENEALRACPKFLADSEWKHLQRLADRVYKGSSQRLARRFPQLTPADRQLCLLIRLRFGNAQIATLIAVSPSSVSQQKFRLKKRMMQADDSLFADGETLEGVIAGC